MNKRFGVNGHCGENSIAAKLPHISTSCVSGYKTDSPTTV
jgi:hypothetical protein